MKRRQFLKGAAGGLGMLAATAADARAFTSQDYPFTLGVASGDPTPDGVVLWTRLAPQPVAGGGMAPVPVLVRWRIADDQAMQQIVQQGVTIAWPGLAHSVHVEVRGLQPDRWYYYQFSTADANSPVGRTRTLPLYQAVTNQFRFAFVSCQDWQNGFYSAYRNLALEDLDLVVHLGDYIYEGAADPEAVRQHDGPEVSSLTSYRNRHALYKTDVHLQAAHAAFPWLVVPDDHEVENDYANNIPQDGGDPAAFLARRANAYRAYYEHMPLRLGSFPTGVNMRIYRGLTFANLVQFSALDTRQYRTNQPCNGSISVPCAGAFDPAATMTGPEQEGWLLTRLHQSTARWNVVAQQTMFARFDFLAGQLQLLNMDQWDGYFFARQRILNFLAARQPSNPIVITGDIHSSWVHDIKTNFLDPASATIGTEFVGGSVTSNFPFALIPAVNAALADNPHTRFFNGLFHGYVRCTVTPDVWQADFRAVLSILDDQSPSFTLASFAVLNGQPGAVPTT